MVAMVALWSPLRCLTITACVWKSSASSNKSARGFVVDRDGRSESYAIMPQGPLSQIVDDGRGVSLSRTSRRYIAAKASSDPDGPWFQGADDFANFSFPGQVISVRVNLGGLVEGCMASLYSVSQPSYNDENWHGGIRADDPVPQLDLFMLNSYKSVHKSHACSQPWSLKTCDLNGTVGYTFDGEAGEYGPGPNFTINTLLPFHVHVAFHWRVRKVHTIMAQDGRRISRASSEYAKNIWQDLLHGQNLALSYWSQPLVGNDEHFFFQCPFNVTFSDMRIRPIWQPAPAFPTTSSVLWLALGETVFFLLAIGAALWAYLRCKRSSQRSVQVLLTESALPRVSPRLPSPRRGSIAIV